MIALKKLLKVEKSKSEIIAKASSEFRWSTLKFLLAILLMTLLIDVFEISFAKQLSFGIGVMTVTGLISLFSVFRAFVNELFILPSTVGDAK
jgi:ABC-type transport system involved in cytochrome bd biosynthesis fused ATPase/permease subunit